MARCDPHGILATPLVTLARDLTAEPDAVPADMAELVRLVAEHEAVEIVVGLPVNLAGKRRPRGHARDQAYAEPTGRGDRRRCR